jgi:4-oxalocrotonate tautomerase
MPHVIVKMYAGRAETQKRTLAEEITRVISKTLGYADDAVSVSIEDVAPKDWAEKIYRLTSWTSLGSSTRSPATTPSS